MLMIAQVGKAKQVFSWFASLANKAPNLTLGEMADSGLFQPLKPVTKRELEGVTQ